MRIKLIGLPHIANAGAYFGIQFEAIGKAILKGDKTGFKGVTLVADVEDNIGQPLIDADKVEEVSDAAYKALKAKANPKKETK